MTEESLLQTRIASASLRLKNFFATLLLYWASTYHQVLFYLIFILLLIPSLALILVHRLKKWLSLDLHSPLSNPHADASSPREPSDLKEATYNHRKTTLTSHLAHHLPRYHLSGTPGHLPPLLQATTTIPYLWRLLPTPVCENIVVDAGGISIDLSIQWSPHHSIHEPALFVIPDLLAPATGSHYLKVLMSTVARRRHQSICVMNTYRMTILQTDTNYLIAAANAFQNLLRQRTDCNDQTLAAISYGSACPLLVKGLARDQHPFVSAVMISPHYDTRKYFAAVSSSSIFRPLALWSLKQKILHDHRRRVSSGDRRVVPGLVAACALSSSLPDLFSAILATRLDENSSDAAFDLVRQTTLTAHHDLERVQIPILALYALDDPLLDSIPSTLTNDNPFLTVGHTPTGGHLGFLTSWNRSWAVDAALSFTLAVSRIKVDPVMSTHLTNMKKPSKMRTSAIHSKRGKSHRASNLSLDRLRARDVLKKGKGRGMSCFEEILVNHEKMKSAKHSGGADFVSRVPSPALVRKRSHDEEMVNSQLRKLEIEGGHHFVDSDEESEDEQSQAVSKTLFEEDEVNDVDEDWAEVDDPESPSHEEIGPGPVAPTMLSFWQHSERVVMLAIAIAVAARLARDE